MWDAGDVEIGFRPSAIGRADPGDVGWAEVRRDGVALGPEIVAVAAAAWEPAR